MCVFHLVLVKDGRLEFHLFLGDSGSTALLKSKSRVDDGVKHRLLLSKHKVCKNYVESHYEEVFYRPKPKDSGNM